MAEGITRDQAIASHKLDCTDGTVIVLCQGAPFCLWLGRDADMAQMAGCTLCQVERYDEVLARWDVLRPRETLQ